MMRFGDNTESNPHRSLANQLGDPPLEGSGEAVKGMPDDR